jgi:hypothetical protein
MTLAFRRTVLLDGERPPDDYVVVHEGRTVGRILRMNSTVRELWLWTQIGWGRPHGPTGGEAKAAFGRAWDGTGSSAAAAPLGWCKYQYLSMTA